MKIAIAHYEYSRVGGIERHLFEVAEGLAGLGHEVLFFGTAFRERSHGGVTFRRISLPLLPNSLRSVAFAARARRALGKERGVLTISSGALPGADVMVAQSCHAAGLSIPEARELSSKGRRNWGIADRIRLRMEQRMYADRRYKRIVSVSQGVARELRRVYEVPASDITVIPNGVNVDSFHPRLRDTSGAATRQSWGIPADQPVILFVGHEFRRKGLAPLLEALGRLAARRWTLLVVGNDDPSMYLSMAGRLGIGGRVHFLGMVRDTAPVYAASDLFVFPTAYEAWPLAMIEAAASGLPILITRVNGTEDFIVDGVNGLFVERAAGDIAKKIELCLNDEPLRRGLAEAARRSSLNYRWERITKEFEALLKSLSTQRPNP